MLTKIRAKPDRELGGRLMAGDKAAVLVCITGPMAIAIGDAASGIPLESRDADTLVVIEVPEFDAIALRCDAAVLRGAFGDRVRDNPALEANTFSASDLWFCTV